MSYNVKRTLLIILCILLAAELVFVGVMRFDRDEDVTLSTQPVYTDAPTEAPTAAPAQTPTETAAPETEAPETEAPTEAPTEPTEQRFLLTFTGDCTLGSTPANWNNKNHFVRTVGENYDWPFANLREYFENDDFTIINLEGVLADEGVAASKRFAFRGPTAYTQIMTGSSVEAVTLANNHTEDYGKDGYASTTRALTDAGITYVEKDNIALHTTDSGLVIGLYAASFDFSNADIKRDIAALKDQGAELIICAMHWGIEGEYRPRAAHQDIAKAAIDAGANIIYGHHPHVLQKIEEYNGGIIYYSLGNCSFGGAVFPQDFDTAIVQQEVIRGTDGSISLGELTIIPCSVSSKDGQNNFQPTPLEEGSKTYERILSKLDGSFKGANLIVDYSKLDNDKDDPTDPPATAAPDKDDTPAATNPPEEKPAATDSPAAPESSGDAGASSGGDAGASSDGDAGASSGGDAGASSGGDAGASSGGDAGTSSGGDAAPAPDSGSSEG